MSNVQLYLLIGLPILANAIFTGALAIVITANVNARLSDLREDMKARFTALEKLMDQRFESLEREIHHREEER
jgi:CBS domain containing-hemolysin-like protein